MKVKRSITFLSLVCALVLGLGTSSMLVADADGDASCKLQGTWIMDFGPDGKLLFAFNGTGDNKGTVIVDWALGDLPDNRTTKGFGVWEKSGPGIYDFTYQGYNYQSNGAVNYTFLNEGTIILTGCNAAEYLQEAKLFGPWGVWVMPTPPGEIHRLLLHQQTPVQ